MGIPGLDRLVGMIVTFIVLSMASGHGELVWKGLAYVRHHAFNSARQSWECPSIFNKNACSEVADSQLRSRK